MFQMFKLIVIFGLFLNLIYAIEEKDHTFSSEIEHDDIEASNSQPSPRTGRAARIIEPPRSAVKRLPFTAHHPQQRPANLPPPNALQKVLLTNYTLAKCNDGTPAGYYIRRSPYGSKVWFVYFEGGWFCFDDDSCSWRLNHYNAYMSSRSWDEYRNGMGVLSGDSDENPLFYAHNFVIAQYCSSDLWSGTYQAPIHGGPAQSEGTPSQFSFLGSRIMDAVFDHLLKHENLASADVVYMAGSSAGGLGVLLNIDRISAMLDPHGVAVRGIADSAWFLDAPPVASKTQHDFPKSCVKCGHNLRDYMKIGLKLWQPILPTACQVNFNADDAWRCLFANNTIQYVAAPVMVVQFLYDEVQSLLSQMARPSTLEDWRHVVWIGSEVRKSLRALRYVFAPACFSHSALIQREWAGLASSAAYRSMGEVMECWMYKLDRILTRRRGRTIVTRSPLPPNTRHQSQQRLTNRCHARALDGCDDPLCNHSCPKVTDPGTGTELNLFDQIMRSDLSAVMQVANILELDPAKLSQQDRGLVLRMLVRRSGQESYSSRDDV